MTTKELTGKVAIVTGAGRNIGRAIALALADGGASVVVNARSNRAEAEAVARDIEAAGGKALVHIGDIANPADVQAMADAAIDDEALTTELRLPGSGAVWLRAEMRARADAARTATRPITVVQVAAVASAAD